MTRTSGTDETQALVGALERRFGFVHRLRTLDTPRDFRTVLEDALAKAEARGVSIDLKGAAQIAEVVLQRCQDGLISREHALFVVENKILFGAVMDRESTLDEQAHARCPMCKARYSRDDYQRLLIVGVDHDEDHQNCSDMRLCTCTDSIGADIECNGELDDDALFHGQQWLHVRHGGENWHSVSDAARKFHVSPGTVRNYIRKGYLTATKIPGRRGAYVSHESIQWHMVRRFRRRRPRS